MEEQVISYFLKFHPLTEEEKGIIREDMNIRPIKKGNILLKEGDRPHQNYFIIQGCIRQYYLVNGEEKTSNFFTEEDWILPFTNTTPDGLSKSYLESLEDAHVLVGDNQRGNELIRKFPNFQRISQSILEKEIARQQNELEKYIRQSPEQRYMDLQANCPDLLNRVPQYHIASYLGIKPESLSRIRKRMANQPNTSK